MEDVSRPLRERLVAFENVDGDFARGRALRKAVPRRTLAQLVPSTRDPVEILVEQNRKRAPDLVPVPRYRGGAGSVAVRTAPRPATATTRATSALRHAHPLTRV